MRVLGEVGVAPALQDWQQIQAGDVFSSAEVQQVPLRQTDVDVLARNGSDRQQFFA
jgi:hypothetical protein